MILYIEDDVVSQWLFRQQLGEKYPLRICDTIAEAKKESAIESFQIIFCDYALPDGYATDLIRYLKNNHIDKPVIVLTKFSDSKVMHSCWKEGAFDFLEKPVTASTLMDLVNIALSHPKPYSFPSRSHGDGAEPAVKECINFEILNSHFGLNEGLITSIFELAEKEFIQLRSALGTLVLCDDKEGAYASLKYHLHRLESTAKNIFAERIIGAIKGIEKAINRQEYIQPSDLSYLNETIDETIVIMRSKSSQNF
ncbi:MAG: response regulator [Bdellovibrionales bacterium]|nr:response regulator [Bdellovibrionales bacterium]